MGLKRAFYFTVGLIALGLGIVGAVTPLLPTVPLVLLAAFCFAQSSQRLHGWIMEHKTFGPMIEDWHARGAISRRAKIWATVSIALAFAIPFILKFPLWIIGVEALVLSCVLIFIWTRPD